MVGTDLLKIFVFKNPEWLLLFIILHWLSGQTCTHYATTGFCVNVAYVCWCSAMASWVGCAAAAALKDFRNFMLNSEYYIVLVTCASKNNIVNLSKPCSAVSALKWRRMRQLRSCCLCILTGIKFKLFLYLILWYMANAWLRERGREIDCYSECWTVVKQLVFYLLAQ